MGRYRGMIGADPLYQDWQKAGCPTKPLPKRLAWMNVAMVGFVMFMFGLLITGFTNANWIICTPIFAIFVAIVGYLWYTGWLFQNKEPTLKPETKHKKRH